MRTVNTVRLDSSEVQGEGSFVVLRKPNWKAMRSALGAFQAAGGEAEQATAGLAMMDAMLPGMIVDWNWTDEAGDLLPLPSADPEAIGDLEPAEAIWLVQQASELVNLDRKNSETPR
jgi:hypothetical protein